jgi:hypothetical protein
MSHSSQKIKKDSNLTINAQIIPKMNISNLSSFSKVNNIKDISHELPIMTTPLDFIKQKKKFIIQDSFDKRGAKNFLKSKEEAMMEIKLDDEILEETKDKNKYNTNSSFFETKPDTNNSKNNDKIRKRTNTISPVLRKKKSKFGKPNYNQNKNSDKNNDNANNIFINNKILEDSKGSDFVYKFFLENANETEDNFQKKYEKIMENAKNKQKNTNLKQNKYHTTIDINQGNIQKFNSAKAKRKRLSIFDFSEHAKNLMKNDGLDESLISIINDNNKKSVKRNNLDSIKNSEKNNDAFLKQKDLSFENMKSGVSIFSILDNLG